MGLMTKTEITPQMAARELLRRDGAKADLLEYATAVVPEYIIGHHHRVLANALERVERGDLTRLKISMPPRHGKSLLVSQIFPCWYLGRNPEKQIVQTGYAEGIALFHSRAARDLFTSPENNAIFPEVRYRPQRDAQRVVPERRQAAQEWGTEQYGNYFAVGIGGALTGRGGNLALIDDPIKNREDANSPTIRRKILEWYRSTLYTRLTPDGAIVLIMTRWHQDDLSATLESEMAEGGEQWETISFPAIDEYGEALWPEKFPLKKLQEIKTAIGSREFAALYQQNPTAFEGGMFSREWFPFMEEKPQMERIIRMWDMAATEKKPGSDPCYTAGVLFGVKAGQYYVFDMKREMLSPMKVEELIKATAEKDGREIEIHIEQEPGSSGITVLDHFRRVVLPGYTVRAYKPTGSKETRAVPVSAAAEAGNVFLARGRWNRDYLDELEAFPYGKYRDQVDVTSAAHEALTTKNPATAAIGWEGWF